ncbi:MAG TPA: nitroreductase family protein, partial [Acidimicrobiia bacterium]
MDTPFDTRITDELLSTTRAVRKRLDLDRPVDPALILECIALAQQAPTATNEQNWRWVVVTDADKKAQLADIYRGGCLTYLERGAVQEED